jgi:hypothetical protein
LVVDPTQSTDAVVAGEIDSGAMVWRCWESRYKQRAKICDGKDKWAKTPFMFPLTVKSGNQVEFRL